MPPRTSFTVPFLGAQVGHPDVLVGVILYQTAVLQHVVVAAVDDIGVSYLRAKKRNDLDRVMALYGSPNERYW